MSDRLGRKYSDHYRGVVGLWRWSVREALSYTVHSKTSLNRLIYRRSTLNGPFREVVGLGSSTIVTIVLYGPSFGTQIKRLIEGRVDLWK